MGSCSRLLAASVEPTQTIEIYTYAIISMAYWWWSIHSRDTHIWYGLYYPNCYLSHTMKRTRNDPIPSWTVSTYRWCIGTNYFWWIWKHLFVSQIQHIYLDDIDTIETIILTWLKTVLCTTCEGEGTTTSCGCGCWRMTVRGFAIRDGCTTWFKWRTEEEEKEFWWNVFRSSLQVDKSQMMEAFELHQL
jgi:hypothetical protein